MGQNFKTIVFGFAFICGICSKDLHVKEMDLELKDNDIRDIINILNSTDDVMYLKNERFARHLEVVTESVLKHLMAELKHQYSNHSPTRRTPMMSLLRKIKSHMQRKDRKRMRIKKHKMDRKKPNRTRFGKLAHRNAEDHVNGED